MAISVYKIKKWMKMLLGNSVFHVNQGEGKSYSLNEVKGYYNDLTEKITRFGLQDDSVPKSFVDTGEEIYFSIAIFQYGLAAYDLFLQNDDQSMLGKVRACADWAVANQQNDGGWETFAFQDKEHPYSSMAQGEAVSLLVRAYKAFGDSIYKVVADKALDFMLRPVEDGGTTVYKDNGIYLHECTHKPCVLNGWIFSAWGLLDYAKAFNDDKILKVWDDTVRTMAVSLPNFDNGYWSKYTPIKTIASPFYHNLHIAQLNVMYKLTDNIVFAEYAKRFEKYQHCWVCRKRAFLNKAWQKIMD